MHHDYACYVETGFWRDEKNRDSVRKTEKGLDGIRHNAKLNSQLKIVKKSMDNATKAP